MVGVIKYRSVIVSDSCAAIFLHETNMSHICH